MGAVLSTLRDVGSTLHRSLSFVKCFWRDCLDFYREQHSKSPNWKFRTAWKWNRQKAPPMITKNKKASKVKPQRITTKVSQNTTILSNNALVMLIITYQRILIINHCTAYYRQELFIHPWKSPKILLQST